LVLTLFTHQTTAGYQSNGGTEWGTLPAAAYTDAHQGDDIAGRTGKVPFNGWANEGLLVFNSVCEESKQDRMDCADFDDNYATWATQFVQRKRPSKRKRRDVVAVYNELSAFSVTDATNP
jgi:hypothetical protein